MSSEKWSYWGDFSDPYSRVPVIVIDQCITPNIAETFRGKGYRVITPWPSSVDDGEFIDVSKQYHVSVVLTRDKGRIFREYERAAIFPPTYSGADIVQITDAIFGHGTLPQPSNGHNGNGNGRSRNKKNFDVKTRWIEISAHYKKLLYASD